MAYIGHGGVARPETKQMTIHNSLEFARRFAGLALGVAAITAAMLPLFHAAAQIIL